MNRMGKYRFNVRWRVEVIVLSLVLVREERWTVVVCAARLLRPEKSLKEKDTREDNRRQDETKEKKTREEKRREKSEKR